MRRKNICCRAIRSLMKLRDQYPSLDALCEDMDVSHEDIIRKLFEVGYEYNQATNQFV